MSMSEDSTIGPSNDAVIDGKVWVKGTTKEMLDTFPKLIPKKEDIFVCTFPRSGTTWTQEIVWQIINDGKIDYRPLHVRMPWVDGMPYAQPENPYLVTSAGMIEKMFECFPSPRVFKSHLPYDLVPKGCGQAAKPQARYIYVMLYYGPWFDHVLSWWKHKDDPDVLILKYEDMKEDLLGTIRKIATFIGKELPLETLERIVSQTSFNAMQKEGNSNFSFLRGFKGLCIRKGEVGNWKDYFTEDQSKRFDSLIKEKLAGSGLEDEF
ncbi:hypothetical protein pdam_00014438 [Pocillopora damicornis]|uniref:Sulfotransferase domain-containing protein n=1 Tax=Pocillopora damicornis TaxID=46731 RepID=A0A3M6U731_POCDA|nr:hypothetical protein pdam_00014438 [Pocillopora damicornis]